HAVDLLDPRPQVGLDPGADDRVPGGRRVDEHVGPLGPDRAGAAQVQPVEQPAEQEQEHDEQGQRAAGDREAAGAAHELPPGQAHRGVAPGSVAHTGSRRVMRRAAPTQATAARRRTATAVVTSAPGATPASMPTLTTRRTSAASAAPSTNPPPTTSSTCMPRAATRDRA